MQTKQDSLKNIQPKLFPSEKNTSMYIYKTQMLLGKDSADEN